MCKLVSLPNSFFLIHAFLASYFCFYFFIFSFS